MKRALTVGINYTGTGSDLKGCLNDVANMKALFEARGFDEIKVITEKEATTAGIKAGLQWLVADTKPGDVIVFHYSGHGSQLPSKNEPDGYEEILCPIDLNWTTRVITDDYLRSVFDKVPNGCNTTLILDCCHSGTALDQNESLIDTRELSNAEKVAAVNRAMAPDSGRYLPPPAKIAAKLEKCHLVEWTASRDVNASAILIAGCRADQTSADAYINGIFQGAATYALLQEVKKDPLVSHRKLIKGMNDFMVAKGYTQRPQLDGFSGLYDEVFLEPFGFADAMEVSEPLAPPTDVPAAVAPSIDDVLSTPPKKDHSLMVYLVLLILALIILATLM